MEENKRVVEINGVKLEVDLREAKKVENYKVGDSIRVLVKKYDDWKTCYGVILDFTEFTNRPAIDILYIDEDYSEVEIKFRTISNVSKDIEIAPINGVDIDFKRGNIVEKLNRKIETKEEELRVLEAKKKSFKKYFGTDK